MTQGEMEGFLRYMLQDTKKMESAVDAFNEDNLLTNYLYDDNENDLKSMNDIKKYSNIKDSDLIGFLCYRHFMIGPLRLLIDCIADPSTAEKAKLDKGEFPGSMYVRLSEKFYKMMSTGLSPRIYRSLSLGLRKQIKNISVGDFVTRAVFFLNNNAINDEIFLDVEKRINTAIQDKDWATIFMDVVLSMTMDEKERLQWIKEQVIAAGYWIEFRYEIARMYRATLVALCENGRRRTVTGLRDSEAESLCNDIIQEEQDKVIMERMEFAEIIRQKDMRIMELEKDLAELQDIKKQLAELMQRLNINAKLLDMKVLVIGDTGRQTSYKRIIEEHSGQFEFLDGIEDRAKAFKAAEKADIVFFFTGYSKHTTFFQLKKSSVQVININTSGSEEGLRNAIASLNIQKVV